MFDIKLLAGLGLVFAGVLGAAYLYVSSLNHKIENLTKQNTALVLDNQLKQEALDEQNRRAAVEGQITKEFDKKREEHKKDFQKKLDRIDKNVSQGKDRPVGPLLGDFFNDSDGVRNTPVESNAKP